MISPDGHIGYAGEEYTRVVLLAIDDEALPVRRNLCLHLTKPAVRAEPVLGPSPSDSAAPDNAAAHFYGTVIRDGDKYRMWYYACYRGRNPDWPPEMARQLARMSEGDINHGPMCYAESADGISWDKPELGQVLFKGNDRNNAVALPHAFLSGVSVLRDDADPDPARRYKLVYQFFPDQADPPIPEYGTIPTIATAVSADGLVWNEVRIPCRDEFVEHCAFYRHGGLFIVGYHSVGMWGYRSEGGADAGRTAVAKLSPDFDSWAPGYAVSFALPEPADPAARGLHGEYDQVHLGVGAVSRGNVCVGLYGRWHSTNWQRYERITCDLGLVVSNDGLRFREPVRDALFLRADDSPATPVPGRAYSTCLCQGNGIVNAGDETRIYHGRWRNVGWEPNADYYAEVAVATIPRDRWGSLRLNPDTTDGLVWSAPIRLPARGWRPSVNATGLSGISVEIADRDFRLIPAFSGANAGRVMPDGDTFDGDVQWTGGDCDRLVGAEVRLCIRLARTPATDPALYAVYLRAGDATA